MKSRREFLAALGAGACAFSFNAFSQQAGLRRIGFLASLRAESGSYIAALRAGLVGLGNVDGKTFSIEFRGQDRGIEQLRDLAAALVRSGVDIIVAGGTPEVLAAKQQTSSIPIVMVAANDAVGMRLVADAQRPGGNVTGSTYSSPQTMQRRLQLLMQAYLPARRVGALVNPTNPMTEQVLLSLKATAKDLNVELVPIEARTRDSLNNAIGEMVRGRINSFVISDDALFTQHAGRLAELAISRRLPAIGQGAYVEAGGLMSYDVHQITAWGRAAGFVNRIMRGARPSEIALSAATRFEMVMNKKSARSVGIAFPQALEGRADRLIEGAQAGPCATC